MTASGQSPKAIWLLALPLALAGAVVVGLFQGHWSVPAVRAAGLPNGFGGEVNAAALSLPRVAVGPGGQITTPLTLSSPPGPVYSVDVVVAYDPAVARAIRVERGALVAGWSIASNLATPGLVRVALAGAAPLQGGGEVLLFVFQAVGPPGSGTDLQLTRGDLNEGSVAAVLEHGHLSVKQPTILVGAVHLQGRDNTPNERWKVPLEVTFQPPGVMTPTIRLNLATDSTGHFTATVFFSGIYDIRVKKARALGSRTGGASLVEGINSLDFGELAEGDANDDGMINSLDYALLATAYLKVENESGFDWRADFDDDKQIDSSDFSLLASNYFKR